MFSVPHLIIIFVVVLIVFGPEKLPDLARNLGKIMGEFRRATGDLRSTFDEHLRDIEREANMRAAAAAANPTISPTEQNAIGQPKIAGAEGTVTADAPRGWTVAPPDSSAGENAAPSATDTAVATQAEAANTNPAGGNSSAAASDSVVASGTGATQAEATTARVDADHERAGESAKADQGKGSDGGSRPA
jgi:sec-independent protein translocase protein TatB